MKALNDYRALNYKQTIRKIISISLKEPLNFLRCKWSFNSISVSSSTCVCSYPPVCRGSSALCTATGCSAPEQLPSQPSSNICDTHTVCKIKWVKPVKECLIFYHPSPVTVVDVHYKRSEMSSIIKTWRWSRLTLSLDLCWYPPVSRCLRCRLKLWRSPCCGWWLHAACNRLMPPCRLTAQWDCRQAAGSPDPAWRTFLQVERQTEQKVWICS